MIFKLLILAVCCSRLEAVLPWGAALKDTRYYSRYHLAPVQGWMNDPNGFCVFNGAYHLFYQYNPVSSLEPGTARWGHAISKDLFHWIDAGIALQNDSSYDKDGVFSGSAWIDSGVMNIFYTGHVKLPDQTPNQNETQELVTSLDGEHFTKYEHNPIIIGKELQPNIRDPKVWKKGDCWYMVLGNSFTGENNQTLGRVLLFKSSDRINWDQVSILAESDGYLGYMWECPDFFELNGYYILLMSPQGLNSEGDKFKNLYQTGYIVGHFSYKSYVFKPITQFRELDHGHDFYATQTILDNNGRRLLVAWNDMWETSYPEKQDGFTGQVTLVRSLSLTKDLRILQKPVKEVISVRGEKLYDGKPCGETMVTLSNKAGEVNIVASRTKDLILYIGTKTSSVQIKYEYRKGRLSLKRDDTDDGLRRTKYRPLKKLKMTLYIDASSIEVFCGEGEVTFSSRFFIDAAINVWLGEGSDVEQMTVYDMENTLYNS